MIGAAVVFLDAAEKRHEKVFCTTILSSMFFT